MLTGGASGYAAIHSRVRVMYSTLLTAQEEADLARPPEEWTPKLTLEEAVDDAPPGQDTTLGDPSLRRD